MLQAYGTDNHGLLSNDEKREEAERQALLLRAHAPQLRQLAIVSPSPEYGRRALGYKHHLTHRYWELIAAEGRLSAKLVGVVAAMKSRCLGCQSEE
jgi:hypothetical protein